MQEIEKGIFKWKYILFNGLEELVLLKCSYYPKWATNLMQSLYKFQCHFSKK